MSDDTSSFIFDRRAGRATRVVMIRGNERHATPDVLEDFTEIPNYVSDLLMRHDGVCFSIYGENLTIPVLLKTYGANGLMELLEQGAIKFHLQSSIITYLEADIDGINPLQSGHLTTSVHKDPSASVDEALRRLTNPPGGAILRALSKSLADAYVTPSSDFAPTVVQIAHDGYKNGRFSQLGLSPNVELTKMDLAKRASLTEVAQELFDLAIIADLKLESLDEFTIGRMCDDSFRELVQARKVADAALTVFQIENLPHLSVLFGDKTIDTKSVPKLRQNRDAVRFRRWLRETTEHTDAAEIGRAYVDAVSRKGNFFESVKGKILKSLGVTALSAGVGAAVAGPVGAAAGAVAGPFIDAGLGLLDQFVLDGILKGWQPRNYFDKVIRPALPETHRTDRPKALTEGT